MFDNKGQTDTRTAIPKALTPCRRLCKLLTVVQIRKLGNQRYYNILTENV